MLELRYKRIVCYRRIPLYGLDDLTSKCRVPVRELIGKCGKYFLEFLSVEVVSRAEEACTEGSIVRNNFGECLCDCRLSCPRQTVKPKDVPILRISGPLDDAVEDGLSGPPQARTMMICLMTSVIHRIQLSQELEVRGFLVIDSV